MTEEELFNVWRKTDGEVLCSRYERDLQDGIFDLSPTPDEGIDSALESIASEFEEWVNVHYPEVSLKQDKVGYPEVMLHWLDSLG